MHCFLKTNKYCPIKKLSCRGPDHTPPYTLYIIYGTFSSSLWPHAYIKDYTQIYYIRSYTTRLSRKTMGCTIFRQERVRDPDSLQHIPAHDRCHEPRLIMMSWEHTWTHSNIFSETALPSPLSLAVPLHHHFFYGNDLTICFSATKVLQFSEKTACNTSKKRICISIIYIFDIFRRGRLSENLLG